MVDRANPCLFAPRLTQDPLSPAGGGENPSPPPPRFAPRRREISISPQKISPTFGYLPYPQGVKGEGETDLLTLLL
jgi:hypothetical protein